MGDIGGLLQGLLRGILGVWTVAHTGADCSLSRNVREFLFLYIWVSGVDAILLAVGEGDLRPRVES